MIGLRVICDNCRKEGVTLCNKGWIKLDTGNNGRHVALTISDGTKYIDAYSGERIDFCGVDCFRAWISLFHKAAMVGVE